MTYIIKFGDAWISVDNWSVCIGSEKKVKLDKLAFKYEIHDFLLHFYSPDTFPSNYGDNHFVLLCLGLVCTLKEERNFIKRDLEICHLFQLSLLAVTPSICSAFKYQLSRICDIKQELRTGELQEFQSQFTTGSEWANFCKWCFSGNK